MRYFGLFKGIDDVRRDFDVPADAEFPTDEQIIVAGYAYEDYEGDAFVLYRSTDGRLWEVNGGHCSCYGLEGQWAPEETTLEAIAMRRDAWHLSSVRDAIAAAIGGRSDGTH